MPKKSKSTKKKEEEKILYLALTFFLGPAVIGASLWALNFVGVGVGVFLEAWGIWGLPEIHPYLKVIINWKNRNKTQTQQVEVKQSPDAKVNTAGRDVNVYNISPESQGVPDPTQPKIVPGLSVGFEAYGRIPGKHLVFLEASNVGPVPVFISSISSLKVKMPDGMFFIPTSDNWDTDKEFPFDLKPGRNLTISRDLKGFATQMKN